MKKPEVDINYLYNIFKDEYPKALQIHKRRFCEMIETKIEDMIREGDF